MSLFDKIIAGQVQVTNLDATEANVEGVVEGFEDVAGEDEAPEETIETTENSAGEETVTESEELNTELLDTADDAEEVANVEEEVAEAEEAAVATESFLANLFAAKMTGGLTEVHCELAHEHVSYISGRLGVPAEHVPALDFSTESFATVGGVTMNTEGAIESVKNFFLKILDGILKGIAWIMDKGAQLVSKLFNNFEKMKSYAAKVKEKLAKATGTPEESTYKSHGGALSLYINGKLSTPGQCVAAMQSVADEIAKRWSTSKIGQEGAAVGEATLKEVEQIEKNVDRADAYSEKYKTETGATQHEHVKSAGIVFARTVGKTVNSILGSMPFTSGTKVSSQEAKRAGVTLKTSESCYLSTHLPRNKVGVTVIGNSDDNSGAKGNSMRVYSRINNYKVAEKSGDVNIPIQKQADLLAAVAGIEKLLNQMQQIKKLMDAAKPAAGKLKNVIWKLRTKYVAISKKAREGRGFMANIRATRVAIMLVNDMIGMLREPGTSFSTYVLFEVKGLLDVISKQADLLTPKDAE
jgi:hypothetical protein